jgi:hypothetical protein
MPRFELIPRPTADGRRLVLHPVPLTRLERLRRLAARAGRRAGAGPPAPRTG